LPTFAFGVARTTCAVPCFGNIGTDPVREPVGLAGPTGSSLVAGGGVGFTEAASDLYQASSKDKLREVGATKEIVMIRSGEELASVPVDKNPFRIGRSPSNELSLPDKTISRHQCEIVEKDGVWMLLDRSGKGTIVDGKTVSEAKLTDGSRIEIGGFELGVRDIPEKVVSVVTSARRGITAKRPIKGSSDKTLSLTGKVAGRFVEAALEGRQLRVGSSTENDLVIKDPLVSRFHCRFYRMDNTWYLRDLESTNGTFINGARVTETEINPGMVIQVGDVVLIVQTPREETAYPGAFGIIGEDPAMQKVFDQLRNIAKSDGTVLITGETGSGKEVVARAIHQLSSRCESKLVVFDCSTVSPNLIDSKLFGHKKGSFTDARDDRKGVFEEADCGTLFIDEIGDLPLELQPKLLRALESREIYRIGENDPRRVDTRIISATNRSLPDMVKAGTFRQDLFFRLKVFMVEIPPLRDRPADIPLLATYFVETKSLGPKKKLSKRALKKLCAYDFPGNVRELANVITVALAMSKKDSIEPEDIVLTPITAAERLAEAETYGKGSTIDETIRKQILDTLKAKKKNITKTAQALGKSRAALLRLMARLGIEKDTKFS
jgi:two-component system response regulator HydG